MFDFTLSAEVVLWFAAASTALSCLAFLPYLRDTIQGSTQPQRASWLIWTVLSSISFASQVAEGATSSLWYAGIQSGGTALIFILAIWKGAGGYLNRRDGVILTLAAMGLGLWYATDSALWALGISISVSLLGGAVTVVKAYRNPQSETASCWLISFAAAICALGSVGTIDPVLMAYPAYLVLLNGAIICAMWLGRTLERPAPVLPLAAVRRTPNAARPSL